MTCCSLSATPPAPTPVPAPTPAPTPAPPCDIPNWTECISRQKPWNSDNLVCTDKNNPDQCGSAKCDKAFLNNCTSQTIIEKLSSKSINVPNPMCKESSLNNPTPNCLCQITRLMNLMYYETISKCPLNTDDVDSLTYCPWNRINSNNCFKNGGSLPTLIKLSESGPVCSYPATPTPGPSQLCCEGGGDYCGTSYADANKRCHASCDGTDTPCLVFAGEKCYATVACQAPSPPPPPPPPTPSTNTYTIPTFCDWGS